MSEKPTTVSESTNPVMNLARKFLSYVLPATIVVSSVLACKDTDTVSKQKSQNMENIEKDNVSIIYLDQSTTDTVRKYIGKGIYASLHTTTAEPDGVRLETHELAQFNDESKFNEQKDYVSVKFEIDKTYYDANGNELYERSSKLKYEITMYHDISSDVHSYVLRSIIGPTFDSSGALVDDNAKIYDYNRNEDKYAHGVDLVNPESGMEKKVVSNFKPYLRLYYDRYAKNVIKNATSITSNFIQKNPKQKNTNHNMIEQNFKKLKHNTRTGTRGK